ncbi:hypothetical protein MKK68_21905 [Methylobacterium sp. E-016]|nr:hypothetical protein [Methylobacterium sp. E-016]
MAGQVDEDVDRLRLDQVGRLVVGEAAQAVPVGEARLEALRRRILVHRVGEGEGLDPRRIEPVQRRLEEVVDRVLAEIARDETDPQAALGIAIVREGAAAQQRIREPMAEGLGVGEAFLGGIVGGVQLGEQAVAVDEG